MAGGDAPFVMVLVCAAVCVGVMMNVTVIVPVSLAVTSSLASSSLIVAAYALGALLGLPLFYRTGHQNFRNAVLVHASAMAGGNLLFWFTTRFEALAGMVLSRVVLGFEGGVMYNANVALLELSHPSTHQRYLSLYQAWVGGGLIFGPCLSSLGLVVGDAVGLDKTDAGALASLFLSLWGAALFVFVCLRLPDNQKLRALASGAAGETGETYRAQVDLDEAAPAPGTASVPEPMISADPEERKWQLAMAAGNCLRLTQRLGWEAGAIIIFKQRFRWGLVLGGFSLGVAGIAQTYGQLYYSKREPKPALKDAVQWFEIVELLGVLVMFGPNKPRTLRAKVFFETSFAVGSVLFSVANCLSAAPYNGSILRIAARNRALMSRTDGRECLLAMTQVGIFAGMLLGPLAARLTMDAVGVNQSTLASVLLIGWVSQKLLTAAVLEVPPAPISLVLSLGGTLLVAFATLSTKLGGTGAENKFSWHPVFMVTAFVGFMFSGQGDAKEWLAEALAARGVLANDQAASNKRKLHAAFMVAATACAAIGFACIFAAHAENHESQIGKHTSKGRAAHVAFGYMSMAWLAVQTAVGVAKIRKLSVSPPVKAFRWHGNSGAWLLLLGLWTCVVGFWVRFNYDGDGWPVPLKLALTAIVAALAGSRMLPPKAPVKDALLGPPGSRTADVDSDRGVSLSLN